MRLLHQYQYVGATQTPFFFWGAAACHGGVGGAIGPIANKEGRFYNRPGVVTQKAERDLPTKNETVQRDLRRGPNSLVLFLHNRLSVSDMLVYYCCRKVWHVGSHAESPVAFACAWRATFHIFA